MKPVLRGSLLILVLLASLGLGGCWWSGADDTSLTLVVADTPVDGAQSVTVAFTGVEIQPAGGGASIVRDFPSPQKIDLLQLQDDNFAVLLDSLGLAASNYQSIRLKLDFSASTITLADGSVHPLVDTSPNQGVFTLAHPFSIAKDQNLTLTVDFDLRQSISLVASTYQFTPVMRVVDANQSGALEGFVDASLSIGGVAITDPLCQPAAYIYAGAGVTPADIHIGAAGQPVETASVQLDPNTGKYSYGNHYLPPGQYTVAIVCAANDDPAAADALTFSAHKSDKVVAGFLTEIDFP